MTVLTPLLQDGQTKLVNRPALSFEADGVTDTLHDYFDVMRYGAAVGDGVADDRTALANADAAAVAVNGKIILSANRTFRVASDLTITGQLKPRGGRIKPDAGVTVTIAQQPDSDWVTQFIDISAGGTVLFSGGTTTAVSPRWWGAKGDSITDDSAAFHAAQANSQPTGTTADPQGAINTVVPAGWYKLLLTSPLPAASYSEIRGAGIGASILDLSSAEAHGFAPQQFGTTGACHRLTITGFSAIGPGTGTYDFVEETANGSNSQWKIEDVEGTTFRNGIRTTNIVKHRYERVRFYECQRSLYIDCLSASVSTTLVLDDCYLDQNQQGAYLERVQSVLITGDTVFENNTRATALTDGNAGLVLRGCESVLVLKAHFEANTCDYVVDQYDASHTGFDIHFKNCLFVPAPGADGIIGKVKVCHGLTMEEPFYQYQGHTYYIQLTTASAANFVMWRPRFNDLGGADSLQYKDENGSITAYPASAFSFDFRTTTGVWNLIRTGILASGQTAASTAEESQLIGDAIMRFVRDVSGKQSWGDGTNPLDTFLYRRIAGFLHTDGAFEADGTISAAGGYSSLSKSTPIIKARDSTDTVDRHLLSYGNVGTDLFALGDNLMKTLLRGLFVAFGGVTNAFAALRSNGTVLECRLADNSAQTKFSALSYQVNGADGVAGPTTFTTVDGKTVTVKGGIITSIA